MKFELNWGGLHRIISGGQTGADQGGLMAAWRHGVETGGQAPLSYKTQDGYTPILESLGLTQGSDYSGRTRANIDEADGTVIIAHHMGSPGTMLTRKATKEAGKPLLELHIIDMVQLALSGNSSMSDVVLEEVVKHASALCDWIVTNQIQVLNVAGNREIRSDGKNQDTMIIHNSTEFIVGMALDVLKADGKLITKKDKVDF